MFPRNFKFMPSFVNVHIVKLLAFWSIELLSTADGVQIGPGPFDTVSGHVKVALISISPCFQLGQRVEAFLMGLASFRAGLLFFLPAHFQIIIVEGPICLARVHLVTWRLIRFGIPLQFVVHGQLLLVRRSQRQLKFHFAKLTDFKSVCDPYRSWNV